MINKNTLNKYIAGTPKDEVSNADDKHTKAVELLNAIKQLQNQVDVLKEDKALQDEIKEDGMPVDLGLAILRIKADAEKGNVKAIEALNKIQSAFKI